MPGRDHIKALFREYARKSGLTTEQQSLGIWLIRYYLWADEEDLRHAPAEKLELLHRLTKILKPTHKRYIQPHQLLKIMYLQEEGYAYAAELWHTDCDTERKRLQRARSRLFEAIRECL